MTSPVVTEHSGVAIVRDDLFPGGTKARFIPQLFDGCDELVYATPAEGGAQFAIASVARALGKRATLFVAQRGTPHARQYEAKALGATVIQIRPGYLSVVRSRASQYVAGRHGARIVPFGVRAPGAERAIACAALSTGLIPDEVWCAAGSGLLSRGLALAWPDARRHAVQVGRALQPADVAGATIHVYRGSFGQPCRTPAPFPSDPHYDAKAWQLCRERRGSGLVLFWNVAGPACAEPQA